MRMPIYSRRNIWVKRLCSEENDRKHRQRFRRSLPVLCMLGKLCYNRNIKIQNRRVMAMGFLFHKKRTPIDMEGVTEYLQKRLVLPKREMGAGLRNDPDNQVKYSERGGTSGSDADIRYSVEDSTEKALLNAWLGKNQSKTFVEDISERIRKCGLKDSEIYKRANLDRRLFSRIMSDRNYRPSRDTAIAAAIGLQLSLPETQDLLSRAGYTLSSSSRRDMIIEYFIIKERYAISDLNEVLESFGEKLLGR